MAVTLKIAFSSRINGQIVIENPEYIPVMGDVVDIAAEDYIQDKKNDQGIGHYMVNRVYGKWV